MINLTSLTNPPLWWHCLPECLRAVRVPVTECCLIYSVNWNKKNSSRAFSMIQIRWAGKDHRRLRCLHWVSLSVEQRNGDGNRGEAFFFSFSVVCPPNCWNNPPPPASPSSPPVSVCYEKTLSLESVTSAWETGVKGKIGGWGGVGFLGVWRAVIYCEALEKTVHFSATGHGWLWTRGEKKKHMGNDSAVAPHLMLGD